jgi:hypothetical protein
VTTGTIPAGGRIVDFVGIALEVCCGVPSLFEIVQPDPPQIVTRIGGGVLAAAPGRPRPGLNHSPFM